MTPLCTQNERVLDYLYEEMSSEERAAFASHLESCESCSSEVRSFQKVRSVFHEIPKDDAAPAEDALQRMTAQILHQAAKQPPDKRGAAPLLKTLSSTRDLPSAEVGKVLPLKRKGILSVLLHPASPILAAAAMALVFVMTREGKEGSPVPAVPHGPTAIQAPVEKTKPAQTPPETKLANETQDPPKDEGKPTEGGQEFGGLNKKKAQMRPVVAETPPPKKPSGGSLKGPDKDVSYEPPNLPVGGADVAAPSPPKTEAAPEGKGPPSPSQDYQAPAPPPPVVQAQGSLPQVTAKQEPVQRAGKRAPSPPEMQEENDQFRQRAKSTIRNDLANQVDRLGNRAGEQLLPLPQLKAQFTEFLDSGRCKEATETLTKMEQRFHGADLQEERAALSKKCPAPLQQLPSFEDDAVQRNLEAPMKTYRKAPPPAPSSPYKADKKRAR